LSANYYLVSELFCEQNVQEVRKLWSLSADRNRFIAVRVDDCYTVCAPTVLDFVGLAYKTDLRSTYIFKNTNS